MSFTDWRKHHGEFFAGVPCLVTGGAGFIGSHITEALLLLGARVTVLDDLSGGDWVNVKPLESECQAQGRLTCVEASILDESALAQVMQDCRYVFHQAALGSVPRSVEQPRRYQEVNVTGTLNVLEAARAAKVQRVMFAASSSAYGDTPTLPKVETMPPSPRSPYAANKVADEALMMAYACSYGLDTVCLRYFNVFGPRQNANSAYAAVIAAFAKALFLNGPFGIYGDGEQSRDFTYVDNAVHANLLAARSSKRIEGQVCNVAVGKRITVNQLATMMAEMAGRPDMKPNHLPDRAGDVKHSLADLARSRALLGYVPVIDFAQGLKITVDWYRSVMQPA